MLTDLNAEGLADTVKQSESLGATVVSLEGSVADEAHSKDAVKLALDTFGKLDVAVNNAGIAPRLSPLTQIEEKVLDQQFNVNVKGVVFGMKYQIPAMIAAKNGNILNVSSMAGLGGTPMAASYGAAKHAVIGLTKTAAVEAGGFNVRVNAVCPFFTDTPMVDNPHINPTDSIDDVNKNLARGCPMKRIARVEEIISVMLMMISPGNTYMNGISVPVDGGMAAI